MPTKAVPLVLLSEMIDGQEADAFVLMISKEAQLTRDGKPYFRVGFRDAGREVNFPIWQDSPLSEDCRDNWIPGDFYKVRARYQETSYGPQLEINKIRKVTAADERDGFDPSMCMARSRFDPQEMFDELLELVRRRISDAALLRLVVEILEENRDDIMRFPAATRKHHAYSAGLVEHVLSVTRTCEFLADKYTVYYNDMQPPLATDLVIAGAVLHDIGKLREYDLKPQGAEYSVEGQLIGHILQGRDMIRQSPAASDVDPETLLRLEHIVVSHQRLPEWGSPKPPMTPEALIVHYADDLDAKFQMIYAALHDDAGDGPMVGRRNPLGYPVFRGQS